MDVVNLRDIYGVINRLNGPSHKPHTCCLFAFRYSVCTSIYGYVDVAHDFCFCIFRKKNKYILHSKACPIR